MDDDDDIVPAAREDYWDEVPEVYDREVAATDGVKRGRKGRDEIAPYGIRRGQPNTTASGDAGMGSPRWLTTGMERGRPWMAALFVFIGCGWISGGVKCGFDWAGWWAGDGRGGRRRA